MSRTFSTSRIQREVIQYQGHNGSSQKSTRSRWSRWSVVCSAAVLGSATHVEGADEHNVFVRVNGERRSAFPTLPSPLHTGVGGMMG